MYKSLVLRFFSAFLVLCLLSACGGQAFPAADRLTENKQPAGRGVLSTEDQQALDEAANGVEAFLKNAPENFALDENGEEGLVPDEANAVDPTPRETTATTTDGITLPATYYPSTSDPAPFLVVYYHWVAGSRLDFDETARWLQNFPKPEAFAPVKVHMSLEHHKTPLMPSGLSVASFAADFRGCGMEGCAKMDGAGWLKDAVAIMEHARKLEGISPETKIIAMGSSIGADAAAYACATVPGCSFVLPLSPGGYLGIPFETNLKKLLTDKVQTTCIGEGKSACIDVKTDVYTSVPQEKGHGNSFFEQGRNALADYFLQSASICSEETLARLNTALEKAEQDYDLKFEAAESANAMFTQYEAVVNNADVFAKAATEQAGVDYSTIDAETAQKLAQNFKAAADLLNDANEAMSVDNNPSDLVKEYAKELSLAARNAIIVKEIFEKDLSDDGKLSPEWEGKSGLAVYWMGRFNDLANNVYVLMNPFSGYLAALQARWDNAEIKAKSAKLDVDAAQKALDDYKARCP